MIYFICICLLIDVIWIMYLYNKTENFIIKKDKEIIQTKERHLALHRYWNARKDNKIKKDKTFGNLKRKLGG